MTNRMIERPPLPCPLCGNKHTVKTSYSYYGRKFCCLDCVIEFEEVKPGFYEVKDINAEGNLVNDRFIGHNGSNKNMGGNPNVKDSFTAVCGDNHDNHRNKYGGRDW